MIQANELRIGNWIQDELGNYKKVTPNDIENLYDSSPRLWIQPIPLTEEILLKCGFEKDYEGYFLLAFNGRLYYYDLEKGFLLKDFKVKTKLNQFPFYSLHQLQNLYFALTNTELEINF